MILLWSFTLASPPVTGAVADGGLPAAAADAGGGSAAAVEGACAEVQGDPVGAESLQPVSHRQMPDRRGLVSHGQAARAAERSEGGRGETARNSRNKELQMTKLRVTQ